MSVSVTSFQHVLLLLLLFVVQSRLTDQVKGLSVNPATGVFAHIMLYIICIVAEKKSWKVLHGDR